MISDIIMANMYKWWICFVVKANVYWLDVQSSIFAADT